MSANKFLDPKNDYAFKRIFGTEKNKEILVHFLNDILAFPEGSKIQSVTFLKPNQDPEVAAKKQSIVDVLCKDEVGVQYIVEMQVARSDSFAKRAQYYAAKAYTNQMNNGDGYQNLKQVIFLAITDFNMFPDKSEFKSDHVILDKESYANDLKDFSFTFLELPKFNKNIDELASNTDKWMYFFKHATHTEANELERLVADDVMISRAYEALDQYYWTEEELAIYEREKKSQLDAQAMLLHAVNTGRAEGRVEGLAEGRIEGRAEGRVEGRIEEKKEIAKNMLSLGIDIKSIALATGLTEEECRLLV